MRKILLTLIIGMFLISCVSALDLLPNVKSFDKDVGEYGIVTIKNSIFGIDWLQLNRVATIQLIENSEICDGNSCKAVKQIEMFSKGKLVDDARFIDLETNESTTIKEYKFQYKVKGDWVDYNYEEVEEGIYEVKLIGELNDIFQKVDWQIKSGNSGWIENWALWTSGLNDGLVSYYDYDDGAGSVLEDKIAGVNNGSLTGTEAWLTSTDCKVGGCLNLTTGDYVNVTDDDSLDLANFTINFWAKKGSIQPAASQYINVKMSTASTDANWMVYITSGVLNFRAGDGAGGTAWTIAGAGNLTSDVWQMVTARANSTHAELFLNGTSIGTQNVTSVPNFNSDGNLMGIDPSVGGTSHYVGALDEYGIWNRSLTDAEITQIFNEGTGLSYTTSYNISVVLSSPEDGATNLSKTNITFTSSLTPSYGNLTNATLKIWNSTFGLVVNTTNLVLGNTTNTTSFFETIQNPGDYNWNVYGCSENSTNTICDYATANRTITMNNINTISESYSTTSSEGATEIFGVNISVVEDTQISTAYLNYNNTQYLGSITNLLGNNYSISRTLRIPGVSTLTNNTFFWNITLEDDTSHLTSRHNQSVSSININDSCDSGMSVIYNLTIVDEITQQEIDGAALNGSIKLDFNLYTSDRAINLQQYYKEKTNTNNLAICIDNNLTSGQEYSIDLQVQYGATNYSTEMYNLEREVLKESTLHQNITLYDLDSTNTQKFKLFVRDSAYTAIGNALVRIERKYIENGTFYVTEIPKTDGTGTTSASLQLDDVIYNFYIYSEGVLVSSFLNTLAICQTPTLRECSIDFNAYQSGLVIPDYESGDDFNFTIDYNTTSKIVTSQFVVLSGNPAVNRLEVVREDTLGTAVCEDTLTSASGTLSCVVPNSFGNSTVRVNLYKDDYLMGWGTVKTIPSPSDIYGVILTIISIFVLITLIGMAVSDNPIITGTFLLIGVILIFAMNLVGNTGFLGATATFLFLAIAIILVLIKAGRRS